MNIFLEVAGIEAHLEFELKGAVESAPPGLERLRLAQRRTSALRRFSRAMRRFHASREMSRFLLDPIVKGGDDA